MEPRINVLFIDSNVAARGGYCLLLSQAGNIRVVSEMERGEEACEQYASLQPNAVIMDLNLPGMGGLATIKRLLHLDPGARILIFTAETEPLSIIRALNAGAKGYLQNQCATETFIEAVRKVSAGNRFMSPEAAQRLALFSLNRTPDESALTSLSARELDVFSRLARGSSPQEVAEEMQIAYKTVANYTTRIRAKLKIQTSADMAWLAYRHKTVRQSG